MNQALSSKIVVNDRVREALAVTLRGVEELLPQDEWVKKLAKSDATGTPLRIKLGLGPDCAGHPHWAHRGVEQDAAVARLGPYGHLLDW